MSSNREEASQRALAQELEEEMRITFEEMQKTIKEALLNVGLSEEQAEACSRVHTESSQDGVYSHGLNRVPRFVQYVKDGLINLEGKPELIKGKGVMENYDGNLGIGILNANFAMNRAMELAENLGIGIVALRNTTHWMRGGTYALEAAEKGYIGICWTNTESCMPAWGAKSQSIGNNPLCMGVPDKEGSVLLDMAMSQFSYGKLEVTRLKGSKLPVPGGYDEEGNLTTDPLTIEETRRILPTGYWKGSGLSVALDLIAAILSNGRSTAEIDKYDKGSCGGCSQIFIAIDPTVFASEEEVRSIVAGTKEQLHQAERTHEESPVRYPGEGMLNVRKKSKEEGILVDERVWNEVKSLAR